MACKWGVEKTSLSTVLYHTLCGLFDRLVHGRCPMGWDSTHCISHGTYGTEIDEQEIKNLLNKHIDSEYARIAFPMGLMGQKLMSRKLKIC